MSFSDLLSSRLIALPLRNPNFGIYSIGNGLSLIGMWMQRIALGWLAWQLTHSGLWLGIVAFADFFPVIVIGPVAGAVADRLDRLRLMKVSQGLQLVQAATLFALTASGHINIWLLVTLTAIQGVLVAFNQPARLAFIPSLVAPSDLASAVAINSVIFNLARFIGPMLAGLAIVWSGVATAFAVNALSYFAFIWALMRIKVEPEAMTATNRGLRGDLMDGIKYTATHPGIGALLVLGIALGVGGRPLNELLPGFAADVYHAGAGGLSILASAIGGGAIVGGLWLAHRSHSVGLTQVVLTNALVSGLAAIAAISSDKMWIAVPSVVVMGFSASVAGIGMQTMIQLATDRNMRGRVMGLYGLIFRGAPAVGALGAGLVSASLGLRWPVFIGALLVVAVWLWTYLARDRIATAMEAHDAGSVA
jgi:predicted MFS family arabinose efflux permease